MSDRDTPRRQCYSEQVGKRNGIWLDSYCIPRLFQAPNVFHVVPRVLLCLFLLTPRDLWLLQVVTLTTCLQRTAANFSVLAQEPQIRPRSISIVGIRSLIPYEPKLAFYGDSRLFVANGLGLEVWDIGQKSLVTTLGGHSYPIDGLALSEREGLVVTAATREIIVRNAISGNVCAMFGWPFDDKHPHVDTVALVGDGDEIVSAGLQGVFVTDIKRGNRKVLWQHITRSIITADASGRLLLVGNTRLQTAALYNMRTREWQRFFVNVKWFPQSAISSTGRFVVVHGSDDRVQVRDIQTGVVVRSYVGNTFGFSPNGKDVTVMAEQPAHSSEAKVYTVALWDTESGEKTAQVGPFSYPVIAAAFSQSGKLLATCDLDEICVWEIPSGRKIFRANVVNVADIRCLGLGKQSNKLIVALSDRPRKGVYGFVEWDLSEGRPSRKNLLAERSRVLGASVCDDGTTIVLLADGQNEVIRIHDLWREAEMLVIREPLPATVSRCAVSADGSTVAVGDNLGTVHLWNLPRKEFVGKIEVDRLPISGLYFDRNGQSLFVIAQGNSVEQWDVRTRTRSATYQHDAQVQGVICTDKNLLFSFHRVPGLGNFALWDRQTNQLRTVITVTGFMMAMTPDGQLAVLGGSHGQLVLYDIKGNNTVKTWQAHDATVSSVVFTGDGRRLISSAPDGRCRVWSMPDCREVVTFWNLADGGWFSSTPEGLFDYDGNDTTLNAIRHLEPGRLELIPAAESRRYYNPEAVKRALAGQ